MLGVVRVASNIAHNVIMRWELNEVDVAVSSQESEDANTKESRRVVNIRAVRSLNFNANRL